MENTKSDLIDPRTVNLIRRCKIAIGPGIPEINGTFTHFWEYRNHFEFFFKFMDYKAMVECAEGHTIPEGQDKCAQGHPPLAVTLVDSVATML